MTDNPNTLAAVTQEDRDAALPILLHLYADDALPIKREQFRAEIHAGGQDKHYIVQAFARHRLSAHPQPTGDVGALVERLGLHKSWRDSHGELNDAPNQAAATILALTAEVERKDAALRECLRQIERYAEFFCEVDFDMTVDIIRAAIGKAET
jgi:hypothetical protein